MKIITLIWLERFVNSYSQGKVTATASSLMTMVLNGLFSWPTAKKSLFIKTKFSLYRFLRVHLSHLTFGLSFFWTAKTVVVPHVVWRAILQMMIRWWFQSPSNHHKNDSFKPAFLPKKLFSYPYKLILGIWWFRDDSNHHQIISSNIRLDVQIYHILSLM